MNKTKLAICMKDLEYQIRFVNCFMNHYKDQYELHVFTDFDQLKIANPLEYAVIITGEYSTEELADFVEREEIILSLQEENPKAAEGAKNITTTEKYQEVYKIHELIERLVAENISTHGSVKKTGDYQRIGVYSLSQEKYQSPFCALLGKIYGEEHKVLILDLQDYSGLRDIGEACGMGLEDLLSAATTGNYSRGRIVECIRHEADFDYVAPAKNNQCFAEGSKELYETLLEILVNEIGYQTVIINFGTMFLGRDDMMELCEILYLLSPKESEGSWREDIFFQELKQLEREVLLQKLRRIEIPLVSSREKSWSALVEKWRWGQFGEVLRHMTEREHAYGADV